MPIDYTQYPTADDVTELLESVGMTLPTGFSVEAAIDSAVKEWENLTGYKPFLAEADERSYTYDPPGPNVRGNQRGGARKLILDRGFVSVSEIRTGVSEDSDGTTLEATDYRLMPYNAPRDGQPYTAIDFNFTVHGWPGSITLTGKAGYSEVLPADAWSAIRDLAAAYGCQMLKEGVSGKMIEWKDGETSQRKSIELLGKWGDTFESRAKRTLRRYKKLSY